MFLLSERNHDVDLYINLQCEAMAAFGFYTPPPPPSSRKKRGAAQKSNEENDPGPSCGTVRQRQKTAENLLQVNVFFQTLNVQTITEDPTYSVS